MTTLITSIGHAPAIVLEGLEALMREGFSIRKVCLVHTKRVRKQFLMLKLALKYGGFESIVLESYELPFEELKSKEECLAFRSKLYEVAKNEAKKCDVKLLVSGGRKSSVVDFVLVALALGVNEIYHVIPKRGSNIYLSRTFAEHINIEAYIDKEPPKHIIEQILEICNPKVREIYLVKIPIPDIGDYCIERINENLSSLTNP